MFIRPILCISLLLGVAACTTPKEAQPTWQSTQYKPMVPERKPLAEPLEMLATDSSVTVFPLDKPVTDPFSDKKMQPVSEKVLGEGYPVLDPSVSVYPLKPPTEVPSVAFENVQTGADANLYSARVKSLAAQRPLMDDDMAFPALPPTDGAKMNASAEEVIGMGRDNIETTALPPIEGPAINVEEQVYTPVQPAKPPQAIFTKPGAKIGPNGLEKSSSQPVATQAPAVSKPPVMPAAEPAAPIMPSSQEFLPPPRPRDPEDAWVPPPAVPTTIAPVNVHEVAGDMPLPTPSKQPLPAPSLPTPKAAIPAQAKPSEGDTIPMPPIPSLTGY